MRALITVPLFLITLFSLGIGASRLIGNHQPAPARIQALHLADCAPPCWNGITPGVSNGSATISQMRSTFPFLILGSSNYPFLSWQTNALSTSETNISIAFDRQDAPVVVSISSNYAAKVMPTFADMLATFGSPSCATVAAEGGSATLGYEDGWQRMVLQFTVNQPALFSPVKSLVIGFSNSFTCQKAAMDWHGFRVLRATLYALS